MNRLVASELEARWNAALAHLRACEARLDEPVVTETAAPDREALLRARAGINSSSGDSGRTPSAGADRSRHIGAPAQDMVQA